MEQEFRPTIATQQASEKSVLTVVEAADYMGVKKSTVLRLCRHRNIKHYRASGKMIFFELKDVQAFMMQNKVSTQSEIKAAQKNNVKN